MHKSHGPKVQGQQGKTDADPNSDEGEKEREKEEYAVGMWHVAQRMKLNGYAARYVTPEHNADG